MAVYVAACDRETARARVAQALQGRTACMSVGQTPPPPAPRLGDGSRAGTAASLTVRVGGQGVSSSPPSHDPSALEAQSQGESALALLESARAVFAAKGLLVDAALCDLARGEAHLGQGNWAAAAPWLADALAVLEPGLPDEA